MQTCQENIIGGNFLFLKYSISFSQNSVDTNEILEVIGKVMLSHFSGLVNTSFSIPLITSMH